MAKKNLTLPAPPPPYEPPAVAPDEPRSADPWAHRSAGMRCATCMAFVEKVGNGLVPVKRVLGRCRRHAPTLGGYPVVFADGWCLDHKLDENKL